MKYQTTYKTPWGIYYLVADDSYLYNLDQEKQDVPLLKKNKNKILDLTKKELDLYFKNKLKKFSVPLKFEGTDFQVQVWNELLKIPYGKTISYKELAQNISNPKAVRAVGGANGKNPISIIVPCHRVITNDGKLGGYSGGLGVKEKLLHLEGALFI